MEFDTFKKLKNVQGDSKIFGWIKDQFFIKKHLRIGTEIASKLSKNIKPVKIQINLVFKQVTAYIITYKNKGKIFQTKIFSMKLRLSN